MNQKNDEADRLDWYRSARIALIEERDLLRARLVEIDAVLTPQREGPSPGHRPALTGYVLGRSQMVVDYVATHPGSRSCEILSATGARGNQLYWMESKGVIVRRSASDGKMRWFLPRAEAAE